MDLQLPSLGSRDVDYFLLGFHGVSPDESDGYIQRLRSIQRLGFPAGLSIGKGHPARYNADQFFQLVAVTELYRCHVPPLQGVKLVENSWSVMKTSILEVWDTVDAGEHGRLLELAPKFWRVPAEGGQRQTRVTRADETKQSSATLSSEPAKTERIEVLSRSQVDDLIDGNDLRAHCHILIDVAKLIGGVFMHLKWQGRPMTPEQIACFMSGMERPR